MKQILTACLLIAIAAITTSSQVSPTTITSESSFSPALSTIVHTTFKKDGSPYIYNEKGEVFKAFPTDYFSKLELYSSSLPELESANFGHAYVQRWTKNPQPGFENKRIVHYVAFTKVALIIENEDYKPEFLAEASFAGQAWWKKYKVRWLNSGDASEVLVFSDFRLYLYTHNFSTKNYFQQLFFGNGPLGSISSSNQRTTAFEVPDDGSNCFFRIKSAYLFVYEKGTELNSQILDGRDTGSKNSYWHHLDANYLKSLNILYIGGFRESWFYSWNPTTKILSHKKTIVHANHSVHFGNIFVHPTNPTNFYFLEKINEDIQIFEVDSTNFSISEKKATIYAGKKPYFCEVELLDKESFTVGVSCPNTSFLSDLISGKFKTFYQQGIDDLQATPIEDKYVKLYIPSYAVVSFFTEIGLMKPRILLPTGWKRFETNPKDPNIGLYEFKNKIYEIDESKEISNPEKVRQAAKLLVELSEPAYADETIAANNQGFYNFRKVAYSSMRDGIIQIGNKNGGGGFYHYSFGKQRKNENVTKYMISSNYGSQYQDSTFLARLQVPVEGKMEYYLIWTNSDGIVIFQETEQELSERTEFYHSIKKETSGDYILLGTESLKGFDGYFFINFAPQNGNLKPKVKFYFFDGRNNPVELAGMEIADTRVRTSATYYFIPGELWLYGSTTIRIKMRDSNRRILQIGNFDIKTMKDEGGNDEMTRFFIPISGTGPDYSFYNLGVDRSVKIASTDSKFVTMCEQKNCALCDSKGICFACESFYRMKKEKNFGTEILCEKICIEEGEFYKKISNECGKCHPSCRACSGPGKKDCTKCSTGFLKVDGSCTESGCDVKENIVTEEFEQDTYKKCINCPKDCKKCDSKGDCIICKEGFEKKIQKIARAKL